MTDFRFDAPKGERLHRYGIGVCIIEKDAQNLWWNTTIGAWESYGTHPEHGYSTHAPCRTLKAYKRMLKKFPDLVGISCMANRYQGHHIYSLKDES